MTLPKISVIIPCFNYANYVGLAIDSVVTQRYPALDLVVVNDGSTDDSLTVIRRQAPNAHVIDQANQGHVAACNTGFAASAGDIVIFLDADDLLEPDALRKVAAAWSPELAKIQFDLKVVDAEGRDLGRRFANFPEDYSIERVRDEFACTATYRWPVTTGNAYSRWFVDLLFPQVFVGCVDGYLNTIAPLYGDVLTLPEVLGRYRLHGNNMSATSRTFDGIADQIARRRTEIAELHRHAAMRGVSLPEVDALDHELPFLNYRLIACRLAIRYRGSERDRPFVLLRRAVRLLIRTRLPITLTAAHMLWFTAISIVPRAVVKTLVQLRFERAQLKRAWKHRLARLGVA
jgi:glycosyltransferase involved in cell wall biosynthesis